MPIKTSTEWRRLSLVFLYLCIFFTILFLLFAFNLLFDDFLSLDKETQKVFIKTPGIGKYEEVTKDAGTIYRYLLAGFSFVMAGAAFVIELLALKKHDHLINIEKAAKKQAALKSAPPKPVAPKSPPPKPAVVSKPPVPVKPAIAQQQNGQEAKRKLEEFWKPASALEQHIQSLADSLLYLFENMPRTKVRVLNEPINGTPNGRRTVAYCLSSTDPFNNYIVIKKDFLICADMEAVENIVKHELIHAWSYWKGFKDNGEHGPIFKAKAAEIGCRLSTEVV